MSVLGFDEAPLLQQAKGKNNPKHRADITDAPLR
jgi:hypothetical protein